MIRVSGLVCKLCTALPISAALLLAGCAQFTPSAALQPAPTIRALQEDGIEVLPAPNIPAALPLSSGARAEGEGPPAKILPISLDTVFRLANDQNGEITLAREKLQEAFAGQDLAAKAWIPNIYVGPSYARHEGGIQDFNGRLIKSSYGSFLAGPQISACIDCYETAYQKVDAERKMWQQRGELSKITSEQLLDASSAYIDLLTAIEAQRTALDIEDKLQLLHNRADKLAKVDKGARIEALRISAEVSAQKLFIRKLRESAVTAEAKIKFLLNIDPAAVLTPVDRSLMPVRLVDPNLPPEHLIERAWSNGPGIQDMVGLLDLIERSAAQSRDRRTQMMPVIEVNVGNGLFGAGSGSELDWTNRFDGGVRLRWDLKKYCTGPDQLRIMDSRRFQAHQTYQNLRGKLALGVQEAREASLSNEERAAYASEQMTQAEEAYAVSLKRLDAISTTGLYGEVLLAVRALAAAHYNRIEALRDLDKAQLRLFVLLGETTHK